MAFYHSSFRSLASAKSIKVLRIQAFQVSKLEIVEYASDGAGTKVQFYFTDSRKIVCAIQDRFVSIFYAPCVAQQGRTLRGIRARQQDYPSTT